MSEKTFSPDWASPPGETIADLLEERRMTTLELATKLGEPVGVVDALIAGATELTTERAQRVASVFGSTTTFWITREAQYREDVRRLSLAADLNERAAWVRELPLAEMVKLGWMDRPERGKEAEACLQFFGERDVAGWRTKYAAVVQSAALRTSPTFDSSPGAVAAWLRQGEIKGGLLTLGPWSAERFRSALREIRPLTRKKKPAAFVPELIRLCAACGVAVVVARAPSGCRASGATRFVSKEKALLLLSFRHRSDDHFWFTFFHEAGHLLLHGDSATFLEGVGLSTREEEEANAFASSELIPPEFHDDLARLRLNLRSIAEFAKRVGVSAGIVIGQLHHRGRIQRNHWNKLRVFYTWDEIEADSQPPK